MICIPKTFRLGGRRWSVKIEALLDGDTDCLGLTDSDEATITLKEGMSPELMNHTFYHELEHAFRATLGLKDGKKEHGEVDARGGILLQYLESKRGRCGGTNS